MPNQKYPLFVAADSPAPLCINCQHFKQRVKYELNHSCHALPKRKSLISGKTTHSPCDNVRSEPDKCGPDGSLFIAKKTDLPVIYLCGKQGIGKTRISNELAQLLGCVKVVGGNSYDDDVSQAIIPGTLVEGSYIEHIRERVPGSIAIDVQDDASIENLITVLRRVAGSGL